MGIHDGHRQKMKQRFLAGGLDSFADHEALELLLFFAIPRRDTNETAHRLMEHYGSLAAVLAAPVEDLKRVDGVGENAAVLLKLVPQFLRKSRISGDGKEWILNSTQRAGEYLMDRFAGERKELVYQLCLDRKGKLLSCRRLTEGSVASADLDVRKLVENALLTSASAVILSHNHPSGIALPSQDDYAATRRVQDALATVGIPLVDHIIVADGDFVSLAESGFLSGK